MVNARGDPNYRTNAHPQAFVRELVAQSRTAFMTTYGKSPLLLVRVSDLAGDLAHGLTENPTASGFRLKDSIGYATVVARSHIGQKPAATTERFDPPTV